MLQTLLDSCAALGVPLTAAQAEQLCDFGARLLEQNRVMNLTAITEPQAVAKLHFADCLALLRIVHPVVQVLPTVRQPENDYTSTSAFANGAYDSFVGSSSSSFCRQFTTSEYLYRWNVCDLSMGVLFSPSISFCASLAVFISTIAILHTA